MINPSVTGKSVEENPFTVGDIDPARSFVHVLDDTSFEVLLRELDTIADFTTYLQAKTRFVRSGTLGMAAGEEELLAQYLSTLNESNEHDFVFDDRQTVFIGEGLWQRFSQSSTFKEAKRSNRISYAWDKLISVVGQYVLEDSLEYSTGDVEGDLVPIRVMASETRFARRILAKLFMEVLETTPRDKSIARVVQSPSNPDVHYVFLVQSRRGHGSYEDYRQYRLGRLLLYCRATAEKFRGSKEILGIAMEPPSSNGGSEDFLHLDVSNWTNKDYSDAAQERAEFDVLLDENVRTQLVDEEEFPRPVKLKPQSPGEQRREKRRKHRLNRRKRKRKAKQQALARRITIKGKNPKKRKRRRLRRLTTSQFAQIFC